MNDAQMLTVEKQLTICGWMGIDMNCAGPVTYANFKQNLRNNKGIAQWRQVCRRKLNWTAQQATQRGGTCNACVEALLAACPFR